MIVSFSLVLLVTIMIHIVGVKEKLAMYINKVCYLVIICCCHFGWFSYSIHLQVYFVGKVC